MQLVAPDLEIFGFEICDWMWPAIMGVLGPALILMMAGIVLTIVLAIMLPIFDMNQLVQ